MTEEPRRMPWPLISVAECLILTLIVTSLFVILIPVVDSARDKKQLPPILPWLKLFYDFNPRLFMIGTPLVTTGIAAAVVARLRCVLPVQIRRHFCWWIRRPEARRSQQMVPIADSRPAIAASTLAFSAAAILLFAATHVCSDRTSRRPIVTWVGPIADYLPQAVYLSWLLSVMAIVLGVWTQSHVRSKWNFLAFIGLLLGSLNVCGTFLFWGLIHED